MDVEKGLYILAAELFDFILLFVVKNRNLCNSLNERKNLISDGLSKLWIHIRQIKNIKINADPVIKIYSNTIAFESTKNNV